MIVLTFYKDIPINPIAIAPASGTAPFLFNASPALPSGILLIASGTTSEIYGTPAATVSGSMHTLTMTTATLDTATKDIAINVLDRPINTPIYRLVSKAILNHSAHTVRLRYPGTDFTSLIMDLSDHEVTLESEAV